MDNRIDAIYGRQSIDKKDSISIESQFEFCRYELKGGEAKEYKDKGYSGKNIERPDFQRLLQDIRLGLIKRVIVYKLDRISRSIVDFAKLMELFKQYDVEFVSCTEKFDTSTPMGRAMLNICIVFAQLERESIQMRVQDAFYSRCTKGYYMRGRTPYGFDTEPIVMDGIKTKKLVENAEMDFAELMFQMYAEPGNSYGDITRYFVKHSIKVYDKALQRGFISKLLRNEKCSLDEDVYLISSKADYDSMRLEVLSEHGSLGFLPSDVSDEIAPAFLSGHLEYSAKITELVPLSQRNKYAKSSIVGITLEAIFTENIVAKKLPSTLRQNETIVLEENK